MVSNSGSYRGHPQENPLIPYLTPQIYPLIPFLTPQIYPLIPFLRVVSWRYNPERDLVISHQARG